MRVSHADSQRGFTLLEVVVAIAVLGLFLGAGLELLALGLRSARSSADVTQAVLLARRTLDEVSLELKPGVVQGKAAGDVRWTAEVIPQTVGVAPSEEDEDLPARLYQVKVKVAWPTGAREKVVELTTLRVAFDEEKLPAVVSGPAQKPGTAEQRARDARGAGGKGGVGMGTGRTDAKGRAR